MQTWRRCTFDQWLTWMFDHEIKSDGFGSYSDSIKGLPYLCALGDERTLEYITQAFENADTAFAPFSNAQLNHGLWYIMSNHGYAEMWMLLNRRITWAKREQCVRSIYSLFERLFLKRCDPVLSYTNQVVNPLNGVCFMWWDLDVIPFFQDKPGMHRINDLCLEVMEKTLYLDSLACQESALHGLNHFPERREDIHSIIDRFLSQHSDLQPELREYALRSRMMGGNM